MGRKSLLTPEQWVEVERKHLVDGQSINSLAKEYKIDEAAIRRKISPKSPNKSEGKTGEKPLRELAIAKVQAEKKVQDISEAISELPMARQQIVNDIARKLSNISAHLASAAEYSAANAHKLSGMAHFKISQVDDAYPLSEESGKTLSEIAVLTDMANEASKIPLGLLKANKDSIDSINDAERTKAKRIEGDVPADVSDAARMYQDFISGK